MKLSTILIKLEKMNIPSCSYVFGTFMDMCGFPHTRSFFNRRTGLISPFLSYKKGDYSAIFVDAFIRLGIRYRLLHVGTSPLDVRIAIVTPIEIDLTFEEIKSRKYLRRNK